MGNAGNLCILIGDAFVGINDQNGNVTAFYGSNGTNDTETLDFFFDFALPTHTRCVDEHIFLTIHFNGRVDGVTGGTGNVADDESVFSQNLVDEGRLTYVRFADDGNFDCVVFFLIVAVFREVCHYLIQHIPQTQCLTCGNGHGIANGKFIKFVNIHGVALHAVYFVDSQHNGFFGAAQFICNLTVIVGNACFYICHKQDHVSGFNGDFRLLQNLFLNDFFRTDFHTAGVDECKFVIQPFYVCVDSVTCYAGGILYDGNAFARQPVEKGGLAHVGTSHHCYDGFAHLFSSNSMFIVLFFIFIQKGAYAPTFTFYVL